MKLPKLKTCLLFFLCIPVLPLSAKDLNDYPLRVEIIWKHWEVYNLAPGSTIPSFVHKVNGHGNIHDGSAAQGFDFEYQGSPNLGAAAPNEIFPARWKKPQQELELLLPDVGHQGKYFTCELETLVRKGVYVRSSQGVVEISQEDYKAGKVPARESGAGQVAPPATSKLSVGSNPASADIEVDGEFVGTTPSVLDLTPGQHTITLQKTGYKPWQKKMELLAGEITLNPDLEPVSAK